MRIVACVFIVLGLLSIGTGYFVRRIPLVDVVQVDVDSGKTMSTFSLTSLSGAALMVLGAGLLIMGSIVIWRSCASTR